MILDHTKLRGGPSGHLARGRSVRAPSVPFRRGVTGSTPCVRVGCVRLRRPMIGDRLRFEVQQSVFQWRAGVHCDNAPYAIELHVREAS